jgi:hypothetical protein
MNRVVLLGVAVFLAIVGIALLGGGSNTALAGHGCCGCCGGGCDCGGWCGGGCGGCHGGYGCHGGGHGCHGGYGCHGGCGGYASHGGGYANGYAVAPAPRQTRPATVVVRRSYQRQPAGFRRISFRR